VLNSELVREYSALERKLDTLNDRLDRVRSSNAYNVLAERLAEIDRRMADIEASVPESVLQARSAV
jgi:predicted transcriptional regulator